MNLIDYVFQICFALNALMSTIILSFVLDRAVFPRLELVKDSCYVSWTSETYRLLKLSACHPRTARTSPNASGSCHPMLDLSIPLISPSVQPWQASHTYKDSNRGHSFDPPFVSQKPNTSQVLFVMWIWRK